MKQDHGLETGLDVHLVPLCKAALPDCETEGCGQEAEPVYIELEVQNTHRAVGTTLSHEVRGGRGRGGRGWITVMIPEAVELCKADPVSLTAFG